MKRIRCCLLGVIPVLNFCLQYYFARKKKKIATFKAHISCYRVDWIFVPINIIFGIFSIDLSRNVILIIGIISIGINYLMFYLRSLDKNIGNDHLITHQKITQAGRVHQVFSSIETTIIIYIIAFRPQGIGLWMVTGLLISFIGLLNYGAYRIHHKLYRSDLLVALLL